MREMSRIRGPDRHGKRSIAYAPRCFRLTSVTVPGMESVECCLRSVKYNINNNTIRIEYRTVCSENLISEVMTTLCTNETNELLISPPFRGVIESMIDNYNKNRGVVRTETCPIKLEIIPDAQIMPFRHTPSKLSFAETEAVEKQMQEWLQKGIAKSPIQRPGQAISTNSTTGKYQR